MSANLPVPAPPPVLEGELVPAPVRPAPTVPPRQVHQHHHYEQRTYYVTVYGAAVSTAVEDVALVASLPRPTRSSRGNDGVGVAIGGGTLAGLLAVYAAYATAGPVQVAAALLAVAAVVLTGFIAVRVAACGRRARRQAREVQR